METFQTVTSLFLFKIMNFQLDRWKLYANEYQEGIRKQMQNDFFAHHLELSVPLTSSHRDNE